MVGKGGSRCGCGCGSVGEDWGVCSRRGGARHAAGRALVDLFAGGEHEAAVLPGGRGRHDGRLMGCCRVSDRGVIARGAARLLGSRMDAEEDRMMLANDRRLRAHERYRDSRLTCQS